MIMENSEHSSSTKQAYPEVVPTLIQYISSNEVAGFDSIERINVSNDQNPIIDVTAVESVQIQIDESPITSHHRTQSISMPATPLMEHIQGTGHALFSGNEDLVFSCGVENSYGVPESAGAGQAKFYSQPMPEGFAHVQAKPHTVGTSRFKDKRFDSFRTWSKKFETQEENGPEDSVVQNPEVPNLPVDRYFDALEGPELDTLRASEELVLPEDKQWPFLLRFPISSFGICLGVSSQAIMWKALATSSSTQFLHISLKVNLILWCISIALVALVSIVYCLKMILYFEAVRREYYHPVRVNFFFAPGIALLFLGLGVPPSLSDDIPKVLWYILMFPIFCLELKIYGQWMSGGQRRLSKVANPSNHLSIVGNFVGALLGASMGLKEGPIFFFAVGLAHYTVLFVTLYQRLPTNETLPKELHPVFFLFVAAPSVASMAWANIQGSFDYGSRIAYFIALFLYFSLAVRVNFFRGFRFSLAWWAYTFPMTGAAIATMKYANEVTNVVTQSLSALLCAIATFTVTALLVTTIFHAFVRRDLFPNDIAIAISQRKPKSSKKWFHLRHGSSDTKDIEILMKSVTSAGKDIESGLSSQNHNESNDNDKNASCPTNDQSK